MIQADDMSVQEALTAVLAAFAILPAETVPLAEALGRVLAQPIQAVDHLPPFTNSSMDGYAVRAADVAQASPAQPVRLQVVGDIAAGQMPTLPVGPGTAVRVMTGAPIPDGADAVVPVEQTDEAWNQATRPLPATIQIKQASQPGDYLRWVGGDVQAGQQLLAAGHLVRPQEIGLMASLGVAQVQVVRRPRVGILATGDELLAVERPLVPGKIRNSNSYIQAAQVAELGALPVLLGIARDDEADIRAKLQAGLEAGVDLFISSAGVSVGAHDVVKTVLLSAGQIGFWRVRMRPGKPLAFGLYKGVPYLGLPGNPVSAMVSFERFARPAILKMAGWGQLERPRVDVVVHEGFSSDGRESYVRATVWVEGDGRYGAKLTGSQDSHLITSLVKANALLIVPEGVRQVEAGQTLAAWILNPPQTS